MSLDKYDITIGLEIHAELNTATKVFCGCKNEFGSTPNTNCCPVCVGMPGALPVLNKSAIEKTITAGLAMGCEINDVAIFERKNYFYPDLSKAYQISQLVKPICIGGGITLKNGIFRRLNRIHLEEDAGKLTHNPKSKTTYVDYNRGGVPLIEIVTEPDFTSSEEVIEFLEQVRERLTFAGVAECKMEEGGMRCDVNLSLKPKGSTTLGNRTETKNLNSLKSVALAIEYEAELQAELLDAGKTIKVETRRWNDELGETYSMRSKEESQDYRYFADPDLYAVKIKREEVENIRNKMPALAYQIKDIMINDFALPEYDAQVLTRDKNIAHFFLDCQKQYNNPKKISNWIMVDLMKIMKENDGNIIPVSTKDFVTIIKLTEDGVINKTLGIKLLEKVIETNSEPMILAKEMGMLETVDENLIIEILTNLKNTNEKLCADYKADSSKVIKFIIGQVMKATKGKAKSDVVEALADKIFG